MDLALPLQADRHTLGAVFKRELRSALVNRYFQVFCALAILGGIAAVFFGDDTHAMALFLVQIALYFVSLFAVLAGVSGAQAEREEWPLLLSQPIPRAAFVFAKLGALVAIFAAVLILLFLPAAIFKTPLPIVLRLFIQTVLLAAAFIACGLAVGFSASDRAQALILGVTLWLLLLVGVDLIALFGAGWSVTQNTPDIWLAVLMLNPLDAFRIEALFTTHAIPPEMANKSPLAAWWIAHPGLWFAAIALVWSVGLSALAALRLNRWED